jgi:hypothetical protein
MEVNFFTSKPAQLHTGRTARGQLFGDRAAGVTI